MKKVLLGVLFGGVLLSPTAYADKYKDLNKLCTALANTAEDIMVLRQNNQPIGEVMSLIVDNDDNSKDFKMYATRVAHLAYSSPIVSEGFKDSAIETFSNDAYLACFDHFGGWDNL